MRGGSLAIIDGLDANHRVCDLVLSRPSRWKGLEMIDDPEERNGRFLKLSMIS